MTNAETVAFELGQEIASSPDRYLQGPDEEWQPGMIAMTGERITAASDLGVELFFEWVQKGQRQARRKPKSTEQAGG